MSEIDYRARVAKGVALLDEKRPGWERLIELETLEIQSGYTCVTAQLSGVDHYRTGMLQLGLSSGDDGTYIAHGFNAEDVPPKGVEDYDQQEAYDILNGLWRNVIADRLDPQPAQG